MFTVEQRDALRERLLQIADEDERVVAAAAVGSLAVSGGDRFSDLDLTFAIADRVPVVDALTIGRRGLWTNSTRCVLRISSSRQRSTACSRWRVPCSATCR